MQEFVAICYKLAGDQDAFEFHKKKLRQAYILEQFRFDDEFVRSFDSHDVHMKFIVADDVPSSRKLLKALITKDGHSVIECVDGEMAVETIAASIQQGKRDGGFDGVFLDATMPVMVSRV